MFMRGKIFTLPILLLPAVFPEKIFSGYPETYGFDARSTGRMNAVTATVNNFSAAYYNPAGLGRHNTLADLPEKPRRVDQELPFSEVQPGKRIRLVKSGISSADTPPISEKSSALNEVSLGYTYGLGLARFSQDVTPNTSNPAYKDQNDYFAQLGLVIDLNNFADLGRGARFALAMALPGDGSLSQIDDINPTVPKFLNYGRANRRFYLEAATGFEIVRDSLYFGLGTNIFAGGSGNILMKNVNLDPAATSPDSQIKMDLKPSLSPNAGLQFHTGNLDLGLSYNHEVKLQFDPVQATAVTTILGAELQLDLAILNLYTPSKMTFGGQYRINHKVSVAADVSYSLWSNYSFSRTKSALADPPNLQNTIAVSVAGIYQARDDIEMNCALGFQQGASTQTSLSSRNNMLDGNVFKTGFGFGYTFSAAKARHPLTLNLGMQVHFLPQVSVQKTDSTIPPGDYNFGGVMLALSLGVTARF
jgi:hypothetical protein